MVTVIKSIGLSDIPDKCNCCGKQTPHFFCETCEEQKYFCTKCESIFHLHPERRIHNRKVIQRENHKRINCEHWQSLVTIECILCDTVLCDHCDYKHHNYPTRKNHIRVETQRICCSCNVKTATIICNTCEDWYCADCDTMHHRKSRFNHYREDVFKKDGNNQLQSKYDQLRKEYSDLQAYNLELLDKLEKANNDLQTHKEIINCLQQDVLALNRGNPISTPQQKGGGGSWPGNRGLLTDYMALSESSAGAAAIGVQDKLRCPLPRRKVPPVNYTQRTPMHDRSYVEGFPWVKCSYGDIPVDAVSTGDVGVYICRADIHGNLVPGHLYPYKYQECYVHHNGIHQRCNYEVLTGQNSVSWKSCHFDQIHPDAVVAGHTSLGERLYIGRIQENGEYRIGKVQASQNGCCIYNSTRTECLHHHYEILISNNLRKY